MGSANFEWGIAERLSVKLMRHARDTMMATMTIDSIELKGPDSRRI